jgi:hypothetical protein
MKQCEFELLPQAEQLDLIQEDGVYIGKKWKKNASSLLYQLDDFYVEVIYKKYRCYVDRIHCFSSTALLDPYLEQVDIEPLGLIIV